MTFDWTTVDDTVDVDGFAISGTAWFRLFDVELIACCEFEIEGAASNGAKVKPPEENDDWGFCGFSGNGLICEDEGLNGELSELKS